MFVGDADFIQSHDLIFIVLYSTVEYHWKSVSANNIALFYTWLHMVECRW